MIILTQMTNYGIFAFIGASGFKLISHKILFINKKDNRNCSKVGKFLKKWQILWINYCKIINIWNATFS